MRVKRECKHPCCGTTCRREKKRYTIRPYSKKRQKENRKYSALRKQFLEDRPVCEAKLEGCTGEASEVHHQAGRGKNLLKTDTWLAVCRNCHQEITDNSKIAIELGLSKSRLTN